MPRLARLALRNPAAPRFEAITAEIGRTVDLVLQLGIGSEEGARRRRLRSIGVVTEDGEGLPVVEDLSAIRRLPDRVAAKLEAAGYRPSWLRQATDA